MSVTKWQTFQRRRELLRLQQMEKRYTIFVSSTYLDLKDERDAVIRTIMEEGHIPLGMEAFGAANASQWQIITDTIDTADYYVLIIGARYGAINEETKISFTEMEFDYAVAQGVPCLVMVMDGSVKVESQFIDNKEEVKRFIAKATHNRQSAFWKTAEQLSLQVMKGLNSEFRRSPRPGWVRPSPAMSPDVANELARLSKENAELKELVEARGKVSRAEQVIDYLNELYIKDPDTQQETLITYSMAFYEAAKHIAAMPTGGLSIFMNLTKFFKDFNLDLHPRDSLLRDVLLKFTHLDLIESELIVEKTGNNTTNTAIYSLSALGKEVLAELTLPFKN